MWLSFIDISKPSNIQSGQKSGVNMFYGEYPHILDIKNRIIIPSKFRQHLGERFVLTKGLQKCLCVFPFDIWQAMTDKLTGISIADTNGQMFNRWFFSRVHEGELDAQGRVLLPSNLREYAEIEKEIVSIGVMNRIEIWSKEIWQTYETDPKSAGAPDFINADLLVKLTELGL